jgi:vacuolar-type H+-ATPase subunit I/STV1
VRERDENSEDENSDSENSENSNQEDNLTETLSSVESLTEMQSVRGNLTSSPADSSQSVRVDQAASLHAAEKTLVVSANQDDDDELSVLMNDPKSDDQSNDQIDDQSDNRLISDENNSLILNYSRSKIRHDYKQLHHKNFVKATKIESIESAAEHDLVISKTFEQIINDSQAKE